VYIDKNFNNLNDNFNIYKVFERLIIQIFFHKPKSNHDEKKSVLSTL